MARYSKEWNTDLLPRKASIAPRREEKDWPAGFPRLFYKPSKKDAKLPVIKLNLDLDLLFVTDSDASWTSLVQGEYKKTPRMDVDIRIDEMLVCMIDYFTRVNHGLDSTKPFCMGADHAIRDWVTTARALCTPHCVL